MVKWIVTVFFFLFVITPFAYAAEDRFFEIQSMDTMKFSRDAARGTSKRYAEQIVPKVKESGATHIAIGTPYDDEFNSTLRTWVTLARANGLNVWYRGNFSGWEGWFEYLNMTDINEHHAKTRAFILANPDLFQEGDIFTPAPEAENGVIGDPRMAADRGVTFNTWLIDSYNTCVQAMQEAGGLATCGFYSFNGDVARQSVTKETYQKIGGVVVIDHYVKSPLQLAEDIKNIQKQFGLPVMLGEIGGPIPDIHGRMTEEQQALYLNRVFMRLQELETPILGLNYWEPFGGSTAIYNQQASFSARLAVAEVQKLYKPIIVTGRVETPDGNPIEGVTLEIRYQTEVQTDSQGVFRFLIEPSYNFLYVTKPGYTGRIISLDTQATPLGETHPPLAIVMQPAYQNTIWKRLQRLFSM